MILGKANTSNNKIQNCNFLRGVSCVSALGDGAGVVGVSSASR